MKALRQPRTVSVRLPFAAGIGHSTQRICFAESEGLEPPRACARSPSANALAMPPQSLFPQQAVNFGSAHTRLVPLLAFHRLRSRSEPLRMRKNPWAIRTRRRDHPLIMPTLASLHILRLADVRSVMRRRIQNVDPAFPHLAESEGLEPPRACARRFSRPVH
jgi:hypothetical protein